MTRIERVIRRRISLLGIAITLLVILCWRLGALTTLDRFLFDQQVAWFQFFTPEPPASLMHLNIDDEDLQAIGKWPWPRTKLAWCIDELRLAGVNRIGLDILFAESTEPELVRWLDGESVMIVNHDANLARSISEHGQVYLAVDEKVQPIDVLKQAAAGLGSVEFESDSDGVLRRIDRESANGTPNLGAVLTGTGVSDLPESLVLPWYGPTGDWTAMLNRNGHEQIFAIGLIYQAADKRHRLNEKAWRLLAYLSPFLNEQEQTLPDQLKLAMQKNDQVAAYDIRKKARQIDFLQEEWQAYQEEGLEGLEEGDAGFRQAVAQLYEWENELASLRADLKHKLNSKDMLVGWSATGAIADFVPTPLHSRTPGVIAHGLVYTALKTSEIWLPVSVGANLLMILGLGLATTLMMTRLSPTLGGMFSLILLVAFVAGGSYFLFDYSNLVFELAGPVVVIPAVWIGAVATRVSIEQAERRQITARFRSYVDPALVNYVLENPTAKLDGERRQMTVVFTDLAGFTPLTEKLGEKTVGVLSEYLAAMVGRIRGRGGYVNKFLGDGIMFFYGAPIPTNDHAINAIATILDMNDAMVEFNRSLAERDLPTLSVRAGVATGDMVVGDSGPSDACDYTVLGDNVNLSARLESANKTTGTQTLINGHCAEQVKNVFLLRPVARIRVVGRNEPVDVYEPLAIKDKASEQQKALAELGRKLSQSLIKADEAAVQSALDELREIPGQEKLIHFYEESLEVMKQAEYDGVIKLTEK